jgi:hypothetical protein
MIMADPQTTRSPPIGGWILLVILTVISAFVFGYHVAPRENYKFNDDEFFSRGECDEETIIENGHARSSWSLTTHDFYISSWGDGPKTCSDLEALFHRVTP